MADENKEKELLMADRRKQIRKIYSDDTGVRTYVRQATFAGSSAFTEATLDRILSQVGSSVASLSDLQKISDYAYATNPNYANIIDYFSNMYLWRYYYVPVQVKEKTSGNYKEIYNLITQIIDGLHIEVIYPIILTNLFKDGVVYLYTEKDTSSKTVITYMLDSRYCFPVMMSQYGTGIFQFDAKYFDDLGLRKEALEQVLELYPEELVKGYTAYKADDDLRYFIIDGRFGSYIRLNEYNFPTKLATLKSIFDYNKYRANEVERNGAQLDKIISHRIPAYQDNLLFELEEVQELHKTMASKLSSNSRTKLLTTFGELEIHPLVQDEKVQNEILEKAHNAIYNTAGLNTNIFNADSAEALKYSISKDSSIIWKYIEQITNFYNLTINNLYNFKGYQTKLTMLPITHYNQSESLSDYRSNAEYGVGRLELIVASGTRQENIVSKAELEDFLKLDEILKPLKSSHTQSGNEKEEKTTEEIPVEEPQEDNPEEENNENE